MAAGRGRCVEHAGAAGPLRQGVSRTGSARPFDRERAGGREAHVVRVQKEEYAVAGDVVVIPLNYFRVLGVEPTSSTDDIRAAYQDRLHAADDLGYTVDTLARRAALLRAAADCIADPRDRAAHAAECATGDPRVEGAGCDLPALLALLQEAGEHGAAIDLGRGYLMKVAGGFGAKDVAISMALALCDTAAEALDGGGGSVAASCGQLEDAIQLLEANDAAPRLQHDIVGALNELSLQLIHEQLAQPISRRNMRQRHLALQRLTTVLWEVNHSGVLSPALSDRDAFLRSIRPLLTASEQRDLYSNLPKGISPAAGELYDLALATIAEGYRLLSPAIIQEAELMLAALRDAQARAGAESEAAAVAVDQAACRILMGDVGGALEALGMGEGMENTADPGIREFIEARSPADDPDPLPGLWALLDRFMSREVVTSFREFDKKLPHTLQDWFEAPSVHMEIAKLDASKVSAARRVANAIKGASGPLLRWMAPDAEGGDVAAAGGDAGADVALTSSGAPAAESDSAAQAGDEAREGGQRRAALKDRIERLLGGAQKEDDYDVGPPTPLPTDPSQMLLLSEDTAMWEAPATRPPLLQAAHIALKVAARGLPLVAVGAAVWKAGLLNRVLPEGVRTGVSAFGSPSTASTATESAAPAQFTRSAAMNAVQRWQSAKAMAMGRSRDVSRLADVLDGQMLKDWQRRVSDIAQERYHWVYRLQNVDVLSHEPCGKNAVMVVARINEVAQQVEDGKLVETFDSAYKMQYKMRHTGQGWKIFESKVLK